MTRSMTRFSLAASLALSGLVLPGMALAQAQDPGALLGLTDVQPGKKPAEYGSDLRGTLPGGAAVKVELDRDGRIEEVEARGANFPIAAVDALVPEAVRAHAQWPKDATLEKIEFERDGRIEIDGNLADGREFDAEFSAAGQLIEFDTDD